MNLRSRILEPTFKRADELLVKRGLIPLPKGLTTHKLRHTFASALIACGEDPISLMRQIGHTDPTFTLRVYTHLMSRDPDERARLKALVRGERVIAREAPKPPLLALEAYEQPILQALADRGGPGMPQRDRRRARRGDGRPPQRPRSESAAERTTSVAATGRQGPRAASPARLDSNGHWPRLRMGTDPHRLDEDPSREDWPGTRDEKDNAEPRDERTRADPKLNLN